jgi:hypothetical protein
MKYKPHVKIYTMAEEMASAEVAWAPKGVVKAEIRI